MAQLQGATFCPTPVAPQQFHSADHLASKGSPHDPPALCPQKVSPANLDPPLRAPIPSQQIGASGELYTRHQHLNLESK